MTIVEIIYKLLTQKKRHNMVKTFILFFNIIYICCTKFAFSDHFLKQKYPVFLGALKQQIQQDPLLKELLNNETKKHSDQQYCICKNFLKMALIPVFQNKSKNYKQSYKNFIDNFRLAINSYYYQHNFQEKNLPILIQQIQKISFIFFTKIKMDDLHQKITKTTAFKGGVKSLVSPSIPYKDSLTTTEKIILLKEQTKYLKTIWNSLKKGKSSLMVSNMQRIYSSYLGGISWAPLDIQRHEGLPRIKFTATVNSSTNPITFIRISTPTIGSDENSYINPEFKAYLAYLKNYNLTHTYVNLQDNRKLEFSSNLTALDMIKTLGINYEFYRSHNIENLENKKTYANSIKTITLSKDNTFYNQEVSFNRFDHNIDEFVEYYLSSILEKKEDGYQISPQILQERFFEEDLRKSFEILKNVLFGTKKASSAQERKMFIELSYFFIIDSLTKKTNYINITCKDGIDRAGATHVLIFIMTLLKKILLEQIPTKEFYVQLERLPEVLFADALSIKKREVIMHRLKTTLQASVWFITQIQENTDLGKYLLESNNLNSLD
jgi:hypothetical protein